MSHPAPPVALGRAGGATAVDVRGAILRASPGYELVPLERLEAPERAYLADPGDDDDDLYGLLRPAGTSQLAPRSASADLALLFLTLQSPGPLPDFAARRLGGAADETIARLVLDGVLELECAGGFVSGPAALSAPTRTVRAESRIAALSRAALEHGQSLSGLPAPLLAVRLYGFGRRPLTPALQERLSDARAVAGFLGADSPGLRARWVESGAGEGERWRMWRRPGPAAPTSGGTFKLYVAPTLEAAPDSFAAVAGALADLPECTGFKVARDVAGLCRPDKLVAYFARLEDLHEAAVRLGPLVRGHPAQPVPFTGQVDADGLLSWGVDPARSRESGRSWRLWLVGRLAAYLVEAGSDGAGSAEPWRFALERIRLDGIDVESWAPESTGWNGTR